MMKQRVIEHFHHSIEAKMAVGEALSPTLAAAAQRIVAGLLAEKKVLCCGTGLSAAMATILVRCLMRGHQIERPGFAAIALDSNAGYGATQGSRADNFSAQIRTLAQAGDILITFSAGESPLELVQAITAAHERGMAVIALTATGDNAIAAQLANSDIELYAENSNQYRVQEIHMLSLFCICDLIEQQLFGGSTV